MIDRTSLEKVRNCINRGQRFVLTTHVNPDGDGLGAEAAISALLTDIDKDVFIYNSSPVPPNYRFLDPDKQMVVYDPKHHREILRTADAILILDISDWHRLRELGREIKDLQITKICIDHHPLQEKFGDLKLVDVEACSTGEIVYNLIKFCNLPITKEIAQALYTCIMTDTGSFRFSNTNAQAFKISGELVECGVKPQRLYQKVYERQPLSKVKLFGHVLSNLRIEENGKVALVQVSKELLNSLGAKTNDTEGFADYPRVIDGVEVSVIFVEIGENKTKVSLRSRGNYVVNDIAQKFGGGGHPYAAGVVIEGQMNEYIPKVLKEVSHLFQES
ncbi:bifunctional oligoribonuclease/PAP phosphatase NrnA [candidate division KSB1 bacterium]|nr:bifunctional oligoribonuclease/PAP phosphatase NrnA [candidate division KSB1 bacterium]NIR72618.1 bifunctional oligoribonuclease/PAP phosphatase NrnA [candidate division KSB1 bacterium]NIS23672.1 bifunctional oligoribonuclease/PAP phosphatase NrnA [candidate division KSB1 bacterium]NIT70882.1 bifunctional oligoribonuclease/PAP phosphatase NrnA [candidate division KSB1 bacterium]NIU24314.1 bifunctional oligoribonuclease/PAP phosphatase NrnA [candidate division KSB1 bacterium]